MAAAQSVTPGATPFRYDYPDAYFDYGGVKLPRSVAGGSKGSGTLNAAGLFVSGLPVFATNGAMTPGHCVSVGSNSTLLDAGAPCGGGGGSSGSVTSGAANQLAYYPATGASVTGLGLSGLSINGGVIAPIYGTAANTVAQGNDARIVGASNASNLTSGTLSDALLAPDVTILGNGYTGSGSLVRGTSPLLVTPLLGTPQSGVATNITGLPLTTGVVGVLPAANGGTGKGSFAAGSDYVAPNGSGSGLTGITAAQVGAVASVTAGAGLSGGTISSSGTIAVIYGTGANTAAQGNDVRITGALQASNNLSDVATPATARTNLGAAAKGANSDITSIAGLTTALTAAQGGTGKTSFTAGTDYLAPSGSGSALTGITASQIGGLAPSATTDTTNATNITTGTIADARLASDVTILGNGYTGGGSLVRAASPVLVTPILGTPQSGVATNLTGLPLTTGVAGVLPPANGGTGKTSFAVGTDYVAPTGSGAGLTGITAAQVGALATNGSGAALTGITAAQVGAISSITAGSGLSGGTISSTGTIAVNYGTAANTAAQGNDSRITGALSVTAAAATYLQLTGGTLSGNLAIAGQAITSGASSALVATDRNGSSGTAQLYRSAGLNYLFDSTYGNTIKWDGAGNVTVPVLIATSATLTSNPAAASNGQDVVTSSWTKQFFPGLTTNVRGSGIGGMDFAANGCAVNCTFFFSDQPGTPTAANAPVVRIQKDSTNSGPFSGPSGTVTNALWVLSTTSPNSTFYDWPVLAEMTNSTGGYMGSGANNVAINGTAFKKKATGVNYAVTLTGSISGNTLSVTNISSGGVTLGMVITGANIAANTQITAASSSNPPTCSSSTPCTYTVSISHNIGSEVITSNDEIGTTWASNFACQDLEATTDPKFSCIGSELDVYQASGSGTDANRQRVGLQIAWGTSIGAANTASTHVGIGLLMGANDGSTMDHAIFLGGTGIYGIGLDMSEAGGQFGTAAILLRGSTQQNIGWRAANGIFDAANGSQIQVDGSNNFYIANNSNAAMYFRGQAGDNRLTLTSSNVVAGKTLDLHYAGTSGTCTVSGYIPVLINGVSHNIPYC